MPNIDLLSMHKQFLNNHIKKGGVVADFTMGNGHDTAWLADAVGEEGHVYAFDIQQAALDSTRARLEELVRAALCREEDETFRMLKRLRNG